MHELPLRDLYGCSWTKSRQQPVKTMAGVRLIHLILSIVGRILSPHITTSYVNRRFWLLGFHITQHGFTVRWNYRMFKELFSINSNLFWKDKNQDATRQLNKKSHSIHDGIASYIYHKNPPFMYVGKYTIRGWWGNGKLLGKFKVDTFGVSSVRWRLQIELLRKGGGPLYTIPPSKIGMPLQPQNSTARPWNMMAKEDYFQGLAVKFPESIQLVSWFQPLWKILVKLDHFPK